MSEPCAFQEDRELLEGQARPDSGRPGFSQARLGATVGTSQAPFSILAGFFLLLAHPQPWQARTPGAPHPDHWLSLVLRFGTC